jgi:hypothetical protein
MVKLNKFNTYLAAFLAIDTISLVYSKLSGYSLGLSLSVGIWALLAIILTINNFIDPSIFQDYKSTLQQGFLALYSVLIFAIFVEELRFDPLIEVICILSLLILGFSYNYYKSVVSRFIFGFSIGTNLTLFFTTPSSQFIIICIIIGFLTALVPISYPYLYIINLNYWNSFIIVYSATAIFNILTSSKTYLFSDYRIDAILVIILTMLGSSYQLKHIKSEEPLLPNQYSYQTFVNSS